MTQIARVLIILFVLLAALILKPAVAAPATVWSQHDSPDINVYYSPNGEDIVQLTSVGINVMPYLDRGLDETWISWVDKSANPANLLKYARLSSNGSLLQTGVVPTARGGLYAPAIALDSSGRRVWLVWAEYNGRTEELFASYLDIENNISGRWMPPLQITPDDDSSASLPSIEQADISEINVSWTHTNREESLAATATIKASDWQVQVLENSQVSISGAVARNQAFSVQMELKDAKLGRSRVRHARHGRSQSAEDVTWERLTRNKKAMMGAIYSDSGLVTRMIDEN